MNVKIKDKEFSCNLLDDEVAKSIPLPIKGNLSRCGDEVYVLKYQNRRSEYVEAFFNVINWKKVNENFKNW